MSLTLITQQKFNSLLCDVWRNEDNDIFMTRDQIGEALEYSEPRKAIAKIHERNKGRLDRFSVVTKLTTTDGKQYETTIYSEKGIYEITRFSKQPKADAFYDFVYELMEGIRKEEISITQPSYAIDDPIKRAERWIAEQKEKMQLETKTKMYEQQIADAAPKLTYVDEVLKCQDLMITSQIADDYGMSAIAFNKLLHEHGVQHKMNDQWLLYTKHKGNGYTKSETKEFRKTDGSTGVKLHTKWTQKGRLFLYELLKSKGIHPTMEQMKLELIENKKIG